MDVREETAKAETETLPPEPVAVAPRAPHLDN
jgi:hypothetical protein